MSRGRRFLSGAPASGRTTLRALLGVPLLLLLGACGGIDPTEPPTIRFGIDPCDRCRMIISDERFAAARWLPDDETFARYDDIGCLLDDLPTTADAPRDEGHGEHATGSADPLRPIWVRDHATGEWVDARAASYVRAEGLETPMDSHLAAFADRETARAFAESSGSARVFGWEDLGARRAGT